jgi:ubiquinone/menaquinone biosynthesis C-methylase UbiE
MYLKEKMEETKQPLTALQSNLNYSEGYTQEYAFRIPKILMHHLADCKDFLDLGCGNGNLIVSISTLYPKIRLSGIDISPKRINALKEKVKGSFLAQNACYTTVQSNSMDVIACEQTIEHVEDDKQLIREIDRILKKKGYLYISSVIKKPYGWYKYKNRLGKRVLDPTHEREYSSEEAFLSMFKRFTLVELNVTPVKRRIFSFSDMSIPGYYIVEAVFRK